MDSANARWHILLLLFVARVGLGFQFQTVGSVSESIVSDLGFDYTDIGTLIGIFMVPGAFLAMATGYAGRYLSDRAPAKAISSRRVVRDASSTPSLSGLVA